MVGLCAGSISGPDDDGMTWMSMGMAHVRGTCWRGISNEWGRAVGTYPRGGSLSFNNWRRESLCHSHVTFFFSNLFYVIYLTIWFI